MIGMFQSFWVIVVTCIFKVPGTIAGFMDVHAIKIGRSIFCYIREIEDFCFYQNSAIRSLIEFYKAA